MARRNESAAELLILCPWWVSVGLAAAVFVFLGHLQPPFSTLAWPATLLLLFLGFASGMRSLTSAMLFKRSVDLDALKALSWKEFEDVVAEFYRREGYEVREQLGGGADGGVDLSLARAGERFLVQCKRWKGKQVPVQTVRELFGVMAAERADAGILITTSSFTREAKQFAAGKRIELIDGLALVEAVNTVQRSQNGTSRPPESETSKEASSHERGADPSCPKCGESMVRRTARRGRNAGSDFWGCSGFPGCRGTISIRL